MTNHVHPLLTPRNSTGVSRRMQHLGQHYVQYIKQAVAAHRHALSERLLKLP